MPPRVIIIGGGISGLSAAYYLSKADIPSTIIERRPRLGGVIQTEHSHNCTLECGPDSYLAVKPAATELIREVGLEGEVIGSNDHLRATYIWRHGRLEPLPDGLMMMVPTKIGPLISTSLLGWGTKVRMGMEYLRRPPAASPQDRSVADFIASHYGKEALEYLAEPLLSGVYGGDPARLSAASVLPRFVELEAKYGSLTKGVLAERKKAKPSPSAAGTLFRTLKDGLGSLVEEVERHSSAALTVIHGEAQAVEKGRVRVRGEWMEADQMVLACPAHESAALLSAGQPELAALLNQIEYTSSLTLNLGYERGAFGKELHGFGFLTPSKERRRLVACTWVANKFSHRVPDDKIVLRCFFGGAGDEAILSESNESVLAIAKDEIRAIMGVMADPQFHVIARWPRSMAQYTVGHQQRLKQIEACISNEPWLHLAGNAYYGIGIPDCIKTGRQAAQRIASR